MKLKKTKKCVAGLVLLLSVFFQREVFGLGRLKFYEGFKPGCHHIDLRDLGFEFVDLIPTDESAITSLVESADGDIYGGTTGRVCHLFVFPAASDKGGLLPNKVKHLGKINGQESIHHSLVAGEDGAIYFGTGLNELQQHPISKPLPGHAGITKAMWADIKKRYSDYEGGHLYRFDISKDKREWIGPEDECLAEDLGVAIPHNGIYTMAINNELKEIYGISYPDGHFFVYRIEEKKFTDVGEIYEKRVFGGPDNRTLRSITRALVCDDNGFVYGSADDGVIFRYDPKTKKLTKLNVKIPSVYYSVAEVFVKDANGVIYGGTSEGYLFRFEPEKMKVSNIGKPLAQLRIRALAVGNGGLIYGIAGERTDHCRLFSYDISEGEFDELGVLRVVRKPYYSWTGLQFDAMVTGKDGIIYIGESERRSHLFLYYP